MHQKYLPSVFSKIKATKSHNTMFDIMVRLLISPKTPTQNPATCIEPSISSRHDLLNQKGIKVMAIISLVWLGLTSFTNKNPQPTFLSLCGFNFYPLDEYLHIFPCSVYKLVNTKYLLPVKESGCLLIFIVSWTDSAVSHLLPLWNIFYGSLLHNCYFFNILKNVNCGIVCNF